MSAKQGHRVLRPHRDWLVLDFVLAAVALVFLAVALSGIALVIGAVADSVALAGDCSQGRCDHAGTLTARQRTHFPSGGYGGLYDVGPSPDYCILTMSLDDGRWQAAVAGPICDRLSTPAPIKAEVWRGNVVAVDLPAGTFATAFAPSIHVFDGLLRILALVPSALCVALIEVDVANHRHVWRVRHRLFGRRAGSPPDHHARTLN